MSYQKFTQQLSSVTDWAKGLVRGLTNKQKRIGVYVAFILTWLLAIIFLNPILQIALFFAGTWWVGSLVGKWIREKFPD